MVYQLPAAAGRGNTSVRPVLATYPQVAFGAINPVKSLIKKTPELLLA